ncbi:MAG: hypothetical protein Q8K30_04810 [Candidatus Gracilibacteria bacterium]|nr:hypothetical protein [Candidatus Gracilibacteria bacterium]
MYKIFYEEVALINVDSFIEYLKKYYKNIYFDTGLVNEEQIIYGYNESTEKLFDEIIDTIDGSIEKGYLGNIFETNIKNEKSKLIINIRSYIIKVIINRIDKDVFIEDILF